MKIITISREFGSGGRELGKRLADTLGFAYYDREIISAIAENSSSVTMGNVSGTYKPPFFARPCTIACAPVTFSPPLVLIKYIT